MAAPIYIFTDSVGGLPFSSYSLQSLLFVGLLLFFFLKQLLTFNASPTTWLQATRAHALLKSLTFPALLLKNLTFTMTGCFGIFSLLRSLYLVARMHCMTIGAPPLVLGSVYTHVCSLTKVHNLSRLTSGQKFCFLFFFLAAQYVGSQFPNQGSNPYSLHWMLRVPTTGSPSTPGKFCSSSSLSGNASYQLAQSILGDICWSWACGDERHLHCPSLLGAPGVCWCSWGCSSWGPYVSRPSLVWWL